MRRPILFIFLLLLVGLCCFLTINNRGGAVAGEESKPGIKSAFPESRKKHRKIIKLRLAASDFDPLSGSTTQETLPSIEEYHIVQFDGPVSKQQKSILKDAGAKIFDYVPDFAFIVKMAPTAKKRVKDLKGVRWVGPYKPEYRINKKYIAADGLKTSSAPEEFMLIVFKGEDFDVIAYEIGLLKGEVLDVAENNFRLKARIRIAPEAIGDVSIIKGVKWIEPAVQWRLFNNVAAGIMGVPRVWDTHKLCGAGQIVAVADTGLDRGKTNPDELHDDFEDGLNNSRVARLFDLVGDGADDVTDGHGTHVAGSVLGNGSHSGSDPVNGIFSNYYSGIAPKASLVFQALENNATEALSGIPTDLGDLFIQAYYAGAMIHTNSWGSSSAGAYTSSSEEVDQFMWEHKDFLILFSAGNSGEDADGDGIINLVSIASPATAKNCISVGATENNRPSDSSPSPGYDFVYGSGSWVTEYPVEPIRNDHLSDDEIGMAAFSSRGPCLDGRIKPDIVAPGTNILSTKSSVATDDGWGPGGLGGGLENYYTFMGGTSMSTPLVAGAAALAREFFEKERDVSPSAALIKAALLAGAMDIAPGQYGAGAQTEIPSALPNNVEGWGRLALENSLFPENSRIIEFLDEKNGVVTSETDTYCFTLNDKTAPLKVVLAWSDYPGSPVSGGGLVNDLDLSIIDPDSKRHHPDNASQRGKTEIIAYDDESYESMYASETIGVGYALKFTPASYPAVLDKARFFLYIPSSSSPAPFRCNVWDDSGAAGTPGTILFSKDATAPFTGWFIVDVPELVIRSGSFFIELRFTTDKKPVLLFDTSNPDDRSYYWNTSNWILMSSIPILGDWAIQAVITDQDISTSYDRVNNVVGINIAEPVMGPYFIHINGYNIPQGPQPYALVVTGSDISKLAKVREGTESNGACFISSVLQ